MGWIFRVERYFAVNEISEAERLQAVGVCLEGKALNWYYWMESLQQMLTWEDFKRELLNRFRHSQKINQYVVLMGLKQVSTVTVFHEEFEKVSTSMECYLECF